MSGSGWSDLVHELGSMSFPLAIWCGFLGGLDIKVRSVLVVHKCLSNVDKLSTGQTPDCGKEASPG